MALVGTGSGTKKAAVPTPPLFARPGAGHPDHMLAGAETIVVHTAGLATTILAALGVALSLLALGWQAWSFRLSGSRVSAQVGFGVRSATAVITGPEPSPEQLARLKAQGFTDAVLAVEVKNSGRSPTSVVAVDLLFQNEGSITHTHLDPPLPYRLDAESERTWYFPAELAWNYASVTEQVMPTGKAHTVRGRVRVGGRKKPIVSGNSIRVL